MFDQLPFGATPIEDSSDLKLPWIKTRNQLNEVEAENILSALATTYSRRTFPANWFTEESLRSIHRNMFGKVWNWAGLYYQGPLRNIGIKSFLIPVQMRELCNDVHYWLKEKCDLTFLQQSARIHFRLAHIHPFPNGNGRHARFVADLYLHSLHGVHPNWPEHALQVNSALRRDYITSLRKADQGDYSHLEDLVVKYGGKNPTMQQIASLPSFKQNPRHLENVIRLHETTTSLRPS